MARRMPILRQDHVGEARREPVDHRDHGVAAGTASAPPGRKSFWISTDQKQTASPSPHQHRLALPISSTTFFASPNTIIVFGM